ncbi:MAG: translation initiation factor IF-2 [Nitrospirae bacterium]|nr:translation initiation factor IF-2 [Nitrospirota bacterium]
MGKLRVYELAKKLNVGSKDIIAELTKLGIEVKSHSSSIEDKDAEKITGIFTKKTKTETPPQTKTFKEAPKPQHPKKEDKKVKTAEEKKLKLHKEVKMEAKKAKAAVEEKAKEGIPPAAKIPSEPHPEMKPEEPPVVQAVTTAQVPAAGEEEEIKVPDRFRKAVEVEMQKAFDTMKRVEVVKKFHEAGGPAYKRHDKRHHMHGADAKAAVLPTQPRKRVLKFQEGTTVKEFAELIGQKLPEVVKKFMELGYMLTINQPVDIDAAQIIAEAFGMKIEPVPVEDVEGLIEEEVDVSKLRHRPPIVTIMGHVDHGKTSLLDTIRKTKITETEAGGITQHIGAYKVRLNDKEIVFLDTPGHEAFTMMRARGAKVTDIVVLVVAADDGVMPQTIEAIDHAKAANVPIVVAINKIDKPEANAAKVRNELAQHGIVSEEWGGQNIFVEVSAKQKIGIDRLLEMILLQAEMMELKADYQKHAKGTIIEAKLDKGRGPVATVIVNSGTLKAGDVFLAGTLAGRVRALVDDHGSRVESAGPSMPIEVIGFPDIPQSGDIFVVMDDERKARQIAMNRFQKQRAVETAKMRKVTLDDLYDKIKEGEIRELNIIIKADVQGSTEAVKDTLENLSHPQVKVRVIHTGVGGINESDVMLATASNAIIIGFNVRPDAKAASRAEKEGVDSRRYNVIYDAIEDIKKALEGLLEPTITEKIQGRAEVRSLFHISKIGTIAGCYVLDGTIARTCTGIRVIRDNIVVYDSKIASLKRFKDDVKEVQSGYECGIQIENFNDIKAGDIFEAYLMEKVATKFNTNALS